MGRLSGRSGRQLTFVSAAQESRRVYWGGAHRVRSHGCRHAHDRTRPVGDLSADGREAWLQRHREDVLDPALPIVDAHHHFYDRPGWRYLLDDYTADVQSGHAIRASVYMQALTRYRESGADALKPVGETEYVAQVTENSAPRVAAGIVGHADLRRGAAVRDVLEAHLEAGRGRFRGVRHLTTWDADATLANPLTAAPAGLLLDGSFRAGLAQLAPNRVDAVVTWHDEDRSR